MEFIARPRLIFLFGHSPANVELLYPATLISSVIRAAWPLENRLKF